MASPSLTVLVCLVLVLAPSSLLGLIIHGNEMVFQDQSPRPRQAPSTDMIELYLIVDYLLFNKSFDNNIVNTTTFIENVAAEVTSIWKKLDVTVVTVALEIFHLSQTVRIPNTRLRFVEVTANYANFQVRRPFDVVFLLTGNTYTNDMTTPHTSGNVFMDAVKCSKYVSGLFELTNDGKTLNSVDMIAVQIAHGLGELFGLKHNPRGCSGVMDANGRGSKDWSSCAKADFAAAKSMYPCLQTTSQTKQCPRLCRGSGTCLVTGICECYPNFLLPDCRTQAQGRTSTTVLTTPATTQKGDTKPQDPQTTIGPQTTIPDQATAAGTIKKPGLSTAIIIAIIIAVLLVLAIIIAVVVTRNKKKKTAKSGKPILNRKALVK